MSTSERCEPYRDERANSDSSDGAQYLSQGAFDEDTSYNNLAEKPSEIPVGFLEARIQRLDEERADRVDRRRSNLNPIQKAFSYIIPYGGIVSSGFNLASSSIGAGIIALPSAFNSSGLVMAIIYLIVVGGLTVYSYTLLAIAGKKTGLRNYEQITYALLGPGADYFLAFCLWFLSFGAEVSYVISLGDVLKAFLNNAESTPQYLREPSGQRLLTSMLWLVFMLPLVLPKEINSLRYLSFVAIIFIIFFVLCMIIHAAQHGLKGGVRDDLVYFQTGNNAIDGLAIFMFAFLSQLNCYEVFDEMYKPGIKRLTLSATLGTGLCFMLYLCSGLFGYLDFGPEASGSSLTLYNPIENKLMAVAYAGIMLKLCVGYGLHMIPVRDAIYHCAKIDVKTFPWWKNACVVTFMATLSLIAGLFIPRINVVFGLVGGFSGGFIGYIYPALMYMYTGNWTIQTVGAMHYFGTYFLLLVGVVGVVFGTASSIYGEVTYQQSH